MLSAILPPVQDCPIGQDPHISRLIKKGFLILDHQKLSKPDSNKNAKKLAI
jgi:hypothetical protein